MLDSPTGDRQKYIVQVLYDENITNNAMEYKGLLARLHAAIGLGIDKIIVKGDSAGHQASEQGVCVPADGTIC